MKYLFLLLVLSALLIRCSSESANYNPGDSLRITYVLTSSADPNESDTLKVGHWKTLTTFSDVHNKPFSIIDSKTGKSLLLLHGDDTDTVNYYMLSNGDFDDLHDPNSIKTAPAKAPIPMFTGKTKIICGYECKEYTCRFSGAGQPQSVHGWMAPTLVQKGKSGVTVSKNDLGAGLDVTFEFQKKGKKQTMRMQAIQVETPVPDQETYFSLKPPAGYRNMLETYPSSASGQ